MPDYLDTARKLRAKAADPVVPEAERTALIERAEKLEAKYGNGNSQSTNDTTTTSRDGRWPFDFKVQYPADEFIFFHQHPPQGYGEEWEKRQRDAERIAEELRKNQWRWNDEYYDKHGNPKPGARDPADLIADEYKYAPNEDEDAGYDDWLGGKLDDE